jgi:nicotinamidase/pyrazinamidase
MALLSTVGQTVPVTNSYAGEGTNRQLGTGESNVGEVLGPGRVAVQVPEPGTLPPHCVQDTPGSFFHPSLRLPHEIIVVSKGTAFDDAGHSAFNGTGLEKFLEKRNIQRLWIGGLAEDLGVLETVEDACRHGFKIHLILDATRALNRAAEPEALQSMRDAGAVIDRTAPPVHTSR